MNDILTIEKVIDFYDLPQLFVAHDRFKTLYLCLLYDDEPTACYTAIRISDQQLSNFMNGRLDLRTMFTHPEVEGEYFDVAFTGNAYHIKPSASTVIGEGRLPAEGYTLNHQSMENITLSIPSSDTTLLLDIARKFGWACVF